MQINIAEFLGIISGLLMIPVYITYYLQVRKGDSIPNPSTWLIWLVVMLLNGATYSSMVGNPFKSLIAIVVPVLLFLMFLYLLTRRKFAKIKKTDVAVLILVLIIGVFWKITNNPKISNLFLQVIMLFSFWPTIEGLIWGDLKEKPIPWMFAVVAYLFTIAANSFDFKGWNDFDSWAKLAYPIINGIIGNGSIAVIAIIKNKRSKASL